MMEVLLRCDNLTVAQLFNGIRQPPLLIFYGIRRFIGISKTDSYKVLKNARCIQLTLLYPIIKKMFLSYSLLHITLLCFFIHIVIATKIGHKFIDHHMYATRSTFFVILDVIIMVIFGDG